MFQSTFPQGERPSPSRPSSRQARFQSTFPQGERQNRWRNAILTNGVSIHVPTRGTTLFFAHSCYHLLCFNPRSHKGNDKKDALIKGYELVSIHVPTRGTTRSSSTWMRGHWCFNPRSHKGNDKTGGEMPS